MEIKNKIQFLTSKIKNRILFFIIKLENQKSVLKIGFIISTSRKLFDNQIAVLRSDIKANKANCKSNCNRNREKSQLCVISLL